MFNLEKHALIIIETEKNNQNKGDIIWKNSKYEIINELKCNNVGNIGEKYIQKLCELTNIKADIDGSKTKRSEKGDGVINEKSVEIKTARIGKIKTFQQELGEHPWNSEYMIFVGFTPNSIYLTIFKNFDMEFYKSNKRVALPYFNKNITLRKETKNTTGCYKLTLTEKDLINCSNCLLISDETNYVDIQNFIKSIII